MSMFRIARDAAVGTALAGALVIAASAPVTAANAIAEPDGLRDHDAGRLLAKPIDPADLRAALVKSGEAGHFVVIETASGAYRVVPVTPGTLTRSQASR